MLRYTGTLDAEEFRRRTEPLPWYHSFHFDNGFHVPGTYDVGRDADRYGFPDDMTGLRVLDVGAANGWFSFHFEQQGAEVTAIDVRGEGELDHFGASRYISPDEEGRPPDRYGPTGEPLWDAPYGRGFWNLHELLGSRVRFRNARVYELCPALFGGETFDLVWMGAILCHLRDPVGALMAARSVCRDRIIASTPVDFADQNPRPSQSLPYVDIADTSWWIPNMAGLRRWFEGAGLADVDTSRTATLVAELERQSPEGHLLNPDMTLAVVHARACK